MSSREVGSMRSRRTAALAAIAIALVLIAGVVFIRGEQVAPHPKSIKYESYDTPLLAAGRQAVCPAPDARYCESFGNDLEVGDLDADGVSEFVAVGLGSDGALGQKEALTVWRYDTETAGLRLLAEGWNNTISYEAVTVALGDLDRDGLLEIVTGGKSTAAGGDASYVSVWRWDGAGNLTRLAHTRWNFGTDTYLADLVIVDSDADGELEILTVGYIDPHKRGIGEATLWNYSRDGPSLSQEGRFTMEDPEESFVFLSASVVPVAPIPRVLAVGGYSLFLLEVTGGTMRLVASVTDANARFGVASKAVLWGDRFQIMVGGMEIDTTRPEQPDQIVVQEVLANATHIEFGRKVRLTFASSANGFARIAGIAISEDGRTVAVTGTSLNLTADTSVLQLLRVNATAIVPYALNEWVHFELGSHSTDVAGVRIAEILPDRQGPEILTAGRDFPSMEIRLWGSEG